MPAGGIFACLRTAAQTESQDSHQLQLLELDAAALAHSFAMTESQESTASAHTAHGHAAHPCCKEQSARPLQGGWWGKSFGIGPSPAVSSRKPKTIIGSRRQSFDELRREQLGSAELFEDAEFPAVDENIFFSRTPPRPFHWRRPHEISNDAHFMIQGTTRFDVAQGELGDCWLLAAVANLTLHPALFARVVPVQSLNTDYTGLFRFNFWQYGHWVEVVIDDRLPTYDGKLVFMHSEDPNEFWSALLEKAYAKLHGSYEALKGGSTSEAMEDFTGGLAELYELAEPPANLFRILLKAHERRSLMGCSLEADPNVFEARLRNGLIRGHAYSVTGVRRVAARSPSGARRPVELLRLRNPWGNHAEWNGAWGDKSQEWTSISAEEREELGLVFSHDGEFWISWEDFQENFDKLEICNLDPDAAEALRAVEEGSVSPLEVPSQPQLSWASEGRVMGWQAVSWKAEAFEGAWSRGSTAGGCRNFLHTFASNPQFRIALEDADEDDEDGKCTCMVALLQKNRRRVVAARPPELLTIGFALYKMEPGTNLGERLDTRYFKTHVSSARSRSFINLREVCCRFRLPAGLYVIVPSSFEPNEEGEFLLRVFSEKPAHLKQVEDRTGFSRPERPLVSAERAAAADDKLASFFDSLAGRDAEVDAWELQRILTYALRKEFAFDEFCLSTCKGLIALVDHSRSGKLDLAEFRQLWHLIRTWKAAFRVHDRDESGSIDAFELRAALKDVGYHLHSRVLQALVLRYSDRSLCIDFDSFIACACKLSTMLEVFDERRGPDGSAAFDLDAFVELTMYS